MCYHPNLTAFTIYFWLHCFLPFLFISSFSRTQTSGSLTLPLKTGSIASSLLPLTIEKLRAYWGGELSRCLLTSWSSIQTERERGGEGRGAERGVTTDAPVIRAVWVSAVESRAATTAATTAAAAWGTFPFHESQQRRRAGWESWAAEREEEVSEPYRKQDGQKLTLGGRETRGEQRDDRWEIAESDWQQLQ